MSDFTDRHTVCSKETPCPICGRDHFCAIKKTGRWVVCTVESRGCVRVTPGGYYLHRLKGNEIKRASGKPKPTSSMKLASPDRLNLIYQALQGQLGLEEYHRKLLQARGLTDAAIMAAGYRTLPPPSKGRPQIAKKLRDRFGDEIFSVPGFIIAEGDFGAYATIAGQSGMLVPVRNADGIIVANKLRRDGVSADPSKKVSKYVWFSSSGEKLNGVSPGAPLHFPLGTVAAIQAILEKLSQTGDKEALAAFSVRITEGELKADAAFLLSGEPTICVPGVKGWRPLIPALKMLGILRIKIAYDADMLEKKSVAKDFQAIVKGMRQAGFIVDVEKWDPAQKGIDDLLYSGGKPELVTGTADVDNYLAAVLDAAGVDEKSEPAESTSSSTDLVKQVLEEAELWHTESREVYVTSKAPPSWTFDIRSSDFEYWLAYIWYQRRGVALNSEALGSALNTLRAHARFDGKKLTVATRVADREGAVVVDLGDDDWKAVVITGGGWEVQANHGVRFRRPDGHQAMPAPAREGNLNDLREFVNIDGERDWILLIAYLLAALRPTGPYPVLCLHGEKGSGKSTLTKIIRKLVDPTTMPLAAMPRTEHEFIIAAINSWITSLDNLKFLPPWFSDALCRLSTGGGFRVRTLFKNSEETLFQAERPTIINGIEELATRGDLLDRCLMLTLPAMKHSHRKDNKRFWDRFEQIRPAIIGCLFDAVACGIRRINEINLPELPRMADLACWITACEPALEWESGTFMRCFRENAADANQIAIEASPVARAIVKFMNDRGGLDWIGTAAELLSALDFVAGDKGSSRKGWPKEPNILSNRISQLSQNLLDDGILIERTRGKERMRGRLIRLTRLIEKSSSASSASSADDVKANTETPCNSGRFESHADDSSNESSRQQVIEGEGLANEKLRADDADDDLSTQEGAGVEIEFGGDSTREGDK